ncbi:hypothetical protein PAHAL_8G033700 [Panicum hallii]|uniref:Uncharacterized protein n=1 Tax=Panicum hallii TaxID=206008 RepID=A0A2T8I7G3_9POAL|nr:hypothetical protein PAHAL_8G033700 [Panicum hallii]
MEDVIKWWLPSRSHLAGCSKRIDTGLITVHCHGAPTASSSFGERLGIGDFLVRSKCTRPIDPAVSICNFECLTSGKTTVLQQPDPCASVSCSPEFASVEASEPP